MSRLLHPRVLFGHNLSTRSKQRLDSSLKYYFSSFGCRRCQLLRNIQSSRRVIWKCRYYSNGQTKPSPLIEYPQKKSKKLIGDAEKLTLIKQEMHKELLNVLNTRVSDILNKTTADGVPNKNQIGLSSSALDDYPYSETKDLESSKHGESANSNSFCDSLTSTNIFSSNLSEERDIPDELYIDPMEKQNQYSVIEGVTSQENYIVHQVSTEDSLGNNVNVKGTFMQDFMNFDASLRESLNIPLNVAINEEVSEDISTEEFLSTQHMKNKSVTGEKQIEINQELEIHDKSQTEYPDDKKSLIPESKSKKKCTSKSVKKLSISTKHQEQTSKHVKSSSKAVKDLEEDPNILSRKVENFQKNLKAYINACVNANEMKLAKTTIKYYVNKQLNPALNMKHLKITDCSVFHRLMDELAKQGSLGHIKELFLVLGDIDLKPSFQCYASYLECLGRQKSINTETCSWVLNDISKHNYILEDIFKACIVMNDGQSYIMKAIKAVKPDFIPNQRIDSYFYSGPLLEGLNERPSQTELVETNPYGNSVDSAFLKKQVKHQMEMEKTRFISVKSVAKSTEPSEKTQYMRKKFDDFKEIWKSQLTEGFKLKLDYLLYKNTPGISLYPYLKLLDVDEYVNIMLKEILLKIVETESYSTPSYCATRLGHSVQDKYHVKKMEECGVTDKLLKIYSDYADYYSSSDLQFTSFRAVWQHLMQKHEDGTDLDGTFEKWPHFVTTGIGKLLYEIITHNCLFDANVHKNTSSTNMVPAFYMMVKKYTFKKGECLAAHPALYKLYSEADLNSLEMVFDVKEIPMLVPPVPWCSSNIGGFLIGPTQFIRLPDSAHAQENKIVNMHQDSLYPVHDALNILGACAWKVNKPVLDIVIDLFNNKGNNDLDIPPPVSECPAAPKIDKKLPTPELLKQKRLYMNWKQMKQDMYSLWCTELYRLSIANKFRDDTFWFPHNIDFRGRTYPCPPHFNQLGNDVSRAILIFAKGKPLGPHGLDWLKIHLINLTGLKKRCSLKERLQYANEIMSDILDSADNPMDGNKWWQKSDEPWQTLACCMEIAKASRSPDPSQYICFFPVHQDGSCNGLQHYAALGRDQAGAESVNLYPFDFPKDVYSDVLELVEEERKKDAENDSPIAKLLDGHITRRVIKQTIMTTVYGVTRYGARQQILGQLQDDKEFPSAHAWKASSYLTTKVFYCLKKMFTSAREIQDWLALTSFLISFLCHKPVEWITPIGFPVVQPYHKPVKISMFGSPMTDKFSMHEKPNVMKQKNAFPPNFIHSLDSTHMMLTALYCFRVGINYVSVHDCFWTHPCDTETMNKITREQFVALHDQPILENLSRHLMKTYSTEESFRLSSFNEKKIIQDCCKLLQTEINNNSMDSNELFNVILQKVPNKGDFDLHNVLNSVYFFS